MKAILSRKGYDDQYGRRPSAIMPDGQMLSFPIPVSEEHGVSSRSITYAGISLEELFEQLGHKERHLNHHLDPDLGLYCINGIPSKCAGVFGQAHIASAHLEKQGVGVGDVFLFFGSFRHVDGVPGSYKYRKGESPFHAIYGYLVVSEIINVTAGLEHEFGAKRFLHHPHWPNRELPSYSNNRLYVGNRYGAFRFTEALRLTKPESGMKSLWHLPQPFADTCLSYHKMRGEVVRDKFELPTVAKGQEFVFSMPPSLEAWAKGLIEEHG